VPLAVLVAVLVWLAAHGEDPDTPQAQPPAAAETSLPVQPVAPTQSPSSAPAAPSSTPEPSPSALESQPASSAAPQRPRPRYEDVAEQFLRAFARPTGDVDTQAWWAGVEPLLTGPAAHDYAGVDPRNVPFTAVTGPAELAEAGAPAELLTIAHAPADAGAYRVEMAAGPEGVGVAHAAPWTEAP